MAELSDDQVSSFMDRVSALTSKLDEELSKRDSRAAVQFAVAIASHCSDGQARDLGAVDHGGISASRFERGRVAFSSVFPGDPFDVVSQFDLDLPFSEDPSIRETLRQVMRVYRRRVADWRAVD